MNNASDDTSNIYKKFKATMSDRIKQDKNKYMENLSSLESDLEVWKSK